MLFQNRLKTTLLFSAPNARACHIYVYPCAQASRVMKSGWCPYIYVCTKKIELEQTRDLIYFKFVATDFFPKISPSTGENSGDSV